MSKLRLGSIGCGGRGWLIDGLLQDGEEVEIVAMADISDKQLQGHISNATERYKQKVNGYHDYREMLEKEKLDGVVITSPDFCHEEQACAALSKGVAVYLEKPIALSIAGADHILATAKKAKAKLMLGHNMRYMRFVLKMRELIQQGAIGEVKAIWVRHFISYGGDAYFRDWHADRRTVTSLLLQKGAHDIDIIHWLAGAYTERVVGLGSMSLYDKLPRRKEALTKDQIDVSFNKDHWPPQEQKDFNPVIDVEDINMLNMQLTNGVQASYMQCHFAPDACRNYTVIGTRGRLENYGDYSQKAYIQLWNKRTDTFNLEGDETYDVSPDETDCHGGADHLIMRGFCEMIRGISTPNSTPQAARYAVATGCLGAESIRNGGKAFEMINLPKALEKYDFSK